MIRIYGMAECQKRPPTLNSSHGFDNQATGNQECKIEVLQKYYSSKILKIKRISGTLKKII